MTFTVWFRKFYIPITFYCLGLVSNNFLQLLIQTETIFSNLQEQDGSSLLDLNFHPAMVARRDLVSSSAGDDTTTTTTTTDEYDENCIGDSDDQDSCSKHHGNDDNNNSTFTTRRATTPGGRSILFVHVGKAGGETIKDVLEVGCKIRTNVPRKEKCYDNLPPSKLSDTVHSYLHGSSKSAKPGRYPIKESTTFLYNIRHPLDRTISWFGFVSPFNCNKTVALALEKRPPNCRANKHLRKKDGNPWVKQFFGTCFHTLNDFALATSKTNPFTNDCPRLAKDIIEGKTPSKTTEILSAHMNANYQKYYQNTLERYPDREVLVVRTNHLWEDLKGVDLYIGGNGTFGNMEGSQYSHGSQYHKKETRALSSDQATKALCCMLKTELMYYNKLLLAASNLSPEEKQNTWEQDMQRCGFSFWGEMLKECPKLVYGGEEE